MQNKTLTNTLDMLIKALCADYERRERIITARDAERRVDNELRYYNFKILDAASEIVGERRAGIFIEEIGASRGYAASQLGYLSEGTYKQYKSLIKENIAKRLYLK